MVERIRTALLTLHRKLAPPPTAVFEMITAASTAQAVYAAAQLGIADALSAGGRERTEQEFRGLLATAGFEIVRIIPTATPDSIVEARKAE
ncbi:hypothetical protein [Nocardia sp. CA-120079]|uniref:hypothetical protein n=1 Tax=Nocardia sp. CA-120079 TaxID=3239974 RepID=UPI003D989A10